MVKQNKEILEVSLFIPRPMDSQFSIQRLFRDINAAFPANISVRSFTSRFESRGLLRRLYNIFEAFYLQREVNHIAGDVHFLSFLLPKKRTLLTIHDCVSLERLRGIRKTIFYIIWYWIPVHRVSMITVVSETTKKELLSHVKCDENKIRVVKNCISSDFRAVPKYFNNSMPVLLQIGTRLNKNLLNVAEALSGIPCHLRIIGRLSDEQRSKLSDCKISYSSVSNVADSDIVKEYINCDVLIFVSTYEGFGLPIIEANATGRAVITSNISSMPEVASDAACLVNPFDVSDIKRGVLRVITDESYRKLLVINGFINAGKYNPDIIANQYIELYKEIHEKYVNK